MSILKDHEDLKPKKVLGFVNGLAVVEGSMERYEFFIDPNGTVKARPMVKEDTSGVDQVGDRKRVPVEQRWVGVDQT